MALLGLTDEEIANDFGISKSTLNRWKKKHREFWDSLTRGKTRADAKVARSLYERANGYEHPETKFFVVKTGRDTEEIQEKQTVTRYPPDTKAAAIWLSNRRDWNERNGEKSKRSKEQDEEEKAKRPESTPWMIYDPATQQTFELDIGGSAE